MPRFKVEFDCEHQGRYAGKSDYETTASNLREAKQNAKRWETVKNNMGVGPRVKITNVYDTRRSAKNHS